MESKKFNLPENPLSARLQSCRLKNQFTDVIVKAGKQEFGAHRAVIYEATPVLKAMLSEHKSNDKDVIEFKEENIHPPIVEDLLGFFYTGEILLTTVNVYSVCRAAHFLQIPELLSASESFICENLDSSNVLDWCLFSNELQLGTLRKRCVHFLFEHQQKVFKDPMNTNFNVEKLKVILIEMDKEIEIYDVSYKESLFEAIAAWFYHDQAFSSFVALKEATASLLTSSGIVKDATNKVSSGTCLTSSFPNKLFCFGGKDKNGKYSSSVTVLDIPSGKWKNSTFNPKLSGNGYFLGGVLGKKIYLFGGLPGESSDTNAFEAFDYTTQSWTKLKPMPQSRSCIGAGVLDGFVYVCGGYDSLNDTKSNVFRYCVKTDQWQKIKSMQILRNSHQLIGLEGLLYAFGGYFNNSVECYDPKTNKWTMVANTRYNHGHGSAISHRGKIYVHSAKGFEAYTPESNTWKALKAPHKSLGCSLVSVKDRIWALGGLEPHTASVYEFDTSTEQWTQLPDMDKARYYHCSFAVNC